MKKSRIKGEKTRVITKTLAGVLCFSMVLQSVLLPVSAAQPQSVWEDADSIAIQEGTLYSESEKMESEVELGQAEEISEAQEISETQEITETESDLILESNQEANKEIVLDESPINRETMKSEEARAAANGTVSLLEIRNQARADFDSGSNENAVSLDLDLKDTVFDGKNIINYASDSYGGQDSPYLKTVNNLAKKDGGTIVMRFKTTQEGVMFGTGSSMSDNGSNMIFGIYTQGLFRAYLRNEKSNGLKGKLDTKTQLMDGNWHTVAVSFNSGNSENCYVVADGGENVYPSSWWPSWLPGFNQRSEVYNTFLVGGGYSISDGGDKNFNGSIDFITLTDQTFTVDQLKELTKDTKDENAAKNNFAVMKEAQTANTWLMTGSDTTSSNFSQTGPVRNYVGFFEDNLRAGGSYIERSRFVFNTAQAGLKVEDINAGYDQLIRKYGPKAVGIMVDRSDYQLGQAGLNSFEQSLSSLLTQIYEEEKIPFLITPAPSRVKEDTDQISLYKLSMEKIAEGFGTKIIDISGLDISYVNESNQLTALGHQAVANAIKSGVGVGTATNYSGFTLQANPTLVKVEDFPQVIPGNGSIIVQAPDGFEEGVFSYELAGENQVISSSNMTSPFTIEGLEADKTYTLTVISEEGSIRRQMKSVLVKAAAGSQPETTEHSDGNTAVIPELKELLNKDGQATYLFMGDSITHGILTDGYDNVPQLFEKYLREQGRSQDVVINAGVSNATLSTTLDQIDRRLNKFKPDVVMVMLGTNDSSVNGEIAGGGNGFTLEQFKENYKNLVRKIYENKADSYIILRVPCDMIKDTAHDKYLDYFNVIHDVAAEMKAENPQLKISVIDHMKNWQDYTKTVRNDIMNNGANGWLKDNVHPNARGNMAMFQQILKESGLYKNDSLLSNYSFKVGEWTGSSAINPQISITNGTITLNMSELTGYENGLDAITVTAEAEDGRIVSNTAKFNAQNQLIVKLPKEFQIKNCLVTGIDSKTHKVISFNPDEDASILFQQSEVRVNDGQLETPVDYTGILDKVKGLSEGTINVRFKTGLNSLMSLFSISNGSAEKTHMHVYINGSKVGYEVRSGSSEVNNSSGNVKDLSVNQWHTVSYVFSSQGTKIYCDGVKVLDNAQKGFVSSVPDVNTVDIGKTARSTGNQYKFTGTINYLDIRKEVMTEAQILDLQKVTVREEKEIPLPENAVKTEDQLLFYAGYSGSIWYRIPSLLTTKSGVVLAAIDKRQNGGGDQGNIDTMVRRSYDNGKNWTDGQIVNNMPSGQQQHALTIDPVMLQDEETGRIFLLADMFPESQAAMNSDILEKGSGYKKVGEKSYCILRDYENKLDNVHNYTKTYTIREHGEVWLEGKTEEDAVPTEYRVPKFSSGELLKNGKPAGNIFLYTGSKAGELKVVRNMRIWISYSDDDGETWSDGADLTSMLKEDWMLFMGLGPGNGIQLKNGSHKGRLLFPVYVGNSKNWTASQASTTAYSDDHGVTWKLADVSPLEAEGYNLETMENGGAILTESQIVEMNDGTLIQFCRNASGALKYSVSTDGGNTWGTAIKDSAVPEVYCQLTAVHYPDKIDEKEAVILANPNGSGRNNGTVRIGLYNPQNKTFEWKYNKLVHAGSYGYSSLAVLKDKSIGLLYEGGDPNTFFTSFNVDWIKAPVVAAGGEPVITKVQMMKSSSGIKFTVDFDSYMIKNGNPVLKFKMDGVEKEAVYESGNASKRLVFSYTGSGDYQTDLAVINVGITASDSTSSIGNAMGRMPRDGEFLFEADGTAKCTCKVEELSLTPDEIIIPAKLNEITVDLKGGMKESTCAKEGHEFKPAYTFTVLDQGTTQAVVSGDKLTVKAAGQVKIKVLGQLNDASANKEFTLQIKKANPGEVVNQAPVALDPVPEIQIDSVRGVSVHASDLAVDPDGDELTITKIISEPASFILTELSGGVVELIGSNEGSSRMMVNVSDGTHTTTVSVVLKVTKEGAYDRSDYLSAHDYLDGSSTVGYGKLMIDTNPSGGTIALLDEKGEKVSFLKGYGAHCNSVLTFNLPDHHSYTEFDTYFGIDAGQPAVSAVSFKISVDGVQKFVSENSLQSTSAMGHARVNITGAKVLKLEATFTNGTNGNGHSVWAGSKLLSEGTAQLDKSVLEAKLAQAGKYQEKDYSAASFAEFKKAVEEAKSVLNSATEQIEIYNQLSALKEAVKGLNKFIPAKRIVLNAEELNFMTAGSRRLYADLFGEQDTISNDTVTFSSSNPTVAQVTQDGLVTVLHSGEAVITAVSTSGVSAECKVKAELCTCVLGTPNFEGQNISIPASENIETVELKAQSVLSGDCKETGHKDAGITYLYKILKDESKIAILRENKLTVTGAGAVTVQVTAEVNGKTSSKEALFTVTKEPKNPLCTCEVVVTEFMSQNIVIPYNEAGREIQLTAKAVLNGSCQVPGHQNDQITYLYVIVKDDSNMASLRENKLSVKGAGKITVRVTALSTQKSAVKDAVFTITKQPHPTYTITLDPAKGKVSQSYKKVNEGEAYGTLPVPTRSGYKFLGWYQGFKLIQKTDKCPGNVKLTAKWKLTAPAKVTGLKASGNTSSTIKLSWNKVAGASKYKIYRYDAKKKKWNLLKTSSAAAYTDKKKKAGTSYRYRVLAVNSAGTGKYSSILTAATKPARPVIQVKKSGKTLQVSWKNQTAEKYVIYTKSAKGSYKKIGTVSGKKLLFKKSKMKKGSYKISVRACVKQSSGYVYSSYSKEKTIKF